MQAFENKKLSRYSQLTDTMSGTRYGETGFLEKLRILYNDYIIKGT